MSNKKLSIPPDAAARIYDALDYLQHHPETIGRFPLPLYQIWAAGFAEGLEARQSEVDGLQLEINRQYLLRNNRDCDGLVPLTERDLEDLACSAAYAKAFELVAEQVTEERRAA